MPHHPRHRSGFTRLQSWNGNSIFRMRRNVRSSENMPIALRSAISCCVPIAVHRINRTELPEMAYIDLPVAPALGREFPGIVGPMTFRPETAAPINELVNVLLRGESTLSRGERELIATPYPGATIVSSARRFTEQSPRPNSATTKTWCIPLKRIGYTPTSVPR